MLTIVIQIVYVYYCYTNGMCCNSGHCDMIDTYYNEINPC